MHHFQGKLLVVCFTSTLTHDNSDCYEFNVNSDDCSQISPSIDKTFNFSWGITKSIAVVSLTMK